MNFAIIYRIFFGRNKLKVLKVFLFVSFFFVLSFICAFLFKDDTNSYSRALAHEFYRQNNIDILFCGASHVSHGMDPRISDKEFGENTFNAGTPSQGINGTYAVIRQALKSYKVSKIYLETDFAIACREPELPLKMGKSDFIVQSFLKDPAIKFQFIKENSSSGNILNAFLPIGKDKLMTLSPKKFILKLKSVLTGNYFKYTYGSKDSGYAGKGCVLDYEQIENGTFSNDKFEAPFKPVASYWKKYVERITELCKENNVELVFYSMPGSDFYLHEKGDYDIFYNEMNSFINGLGYDYYDFNLCKPKFQMEDSDYSDDNHLNAKGIEKFSHIFCNFFTGKVSKDNMFYSSYKEKTNSQEHKIYGLLVIKSENGGSFEIIPMTNISDKSIITYDVSIQNLSGNEILAEKTGKTVFSLPSGTSGKIFVKSYVNGLLNNSVKENYTAF